MHRTIVAIAAAGASLLLPGNPVVAMEGNPGETPNPAGDNYVGEPADDSLQDDDGGQEWGGGFSSWPGLTNEGGFTGGVGGGLRDDERSRPGDHDYHNEDR